MKLMNTITNQRKPSAFNGNYIEYEFKGDKDKNLSPKEYNAMTRPYLSDMINDHKTRREWKIQLTMQINFISSKDSEETCTMHTKSHNIEIMMGNETDEIIEKLFESLLQNSQKDLEESMGGSEFVFDTYLLHGLTCVVPRVREYWFIVLPPRKNRFEKWQILLNGQKIKNKSKK